MAKISLREYIHKIESLIDRGETDQAIFHSKSILKTYPKHIDSYRLMGKAFLEKKKFGDAADIFQRVLSSVSDDFISHIGMSIIREDENNLDEAIWHMERAFETQPSNKTVQEELMKLYSMRDGVTPPKIRLTRGALVRMYVKGELYSQAIAEIQAALNEDPNRVDLEVVLAQLYNLTGQKIEAMEICSKLISKLPYCYEANLILTELLPGTGRSEDEKIFRQRLIELDPYFEFIEGSNTSSIDVPDNKIMLDYIEYDGTQFDQIKPDWAESLGLDINDEVVSEDVVPDDWFNFEQPAEDNPVVSDTIESEISNENNDETIISDTTRTDLSELLKSDEKDEPLIPDFNDAKEDSVLPDWIKDAGWSQAEDENIEIQKGFNIIEENESEIAEEPDVTEQIEIEPGEIPAWLKEIAPTEKIHDLNNLDDEENTFEDDQEFESLFDRLTEQEEGGLKENLDPSLEWLKEFQADENEEISPFKEEAVLEEHQLSDSEIESIEDNSEETTEPVVESENLEVEEVDILESDETEKLELISESLIEIEQTDQVESELEHHQANSEVEETPEQESESEMSWLEAISENELLNQNKEDEISDENIEIPDWMKSFENEEDSIETQGDEVIKSVLSEKDSASEESFELPDWLQLGDEGQTEESDVEIEKISGEQQSLEEDVEDQLAGIDEIDLEIEKTLEELSPTNFIAEEGSEISEEEIPGGITESEQSVFIEDLEVEQENIDSALTWMESLALKHGASEDTLISKPEERDENPPEWIKALSSFDQEESAQLINEPEEIQNFDNEKDSLTPDWLQALQIETNDVDFKEPESENIVNATHLETETDITDVDTVISKEVDEEIEELLRETGQLQRSEEVEAEDVDTQIIDQVQPEEEIQTETEFEEEIEISEDLDETQEIEKISKTVDEGLEEIEEFEKISSTVDEDLFESQEFEAVTSGVDETPISKSSQERLDFAKQLILKGKIDEALEVYNEFIHAELVLDKVIIDLQDALNNKYPIDINLWQALGDAQLRNNQLQEALDSYTKAEELLS